MPAHTSSIICTMRMARNFFFQFSCKNVERNVDGIYDLYLCENKHIELEKAFITFFCRSLSLLNNCNKLRKKNIIRILPIMKNRQLRACCYIKILGFVFCKTKFNSTCGPYHSKP